MGLGSASFRVSEALGQTQPLLGVALANGRVGQGTFHVGCANASGEQVQPMEQREDSALALLASVTQCSRRPPPWPLGWALLVSGEAKPIISS